MIPIGTLISMGRNAANICDNDNDVRPEIPRIIAGLLLHVHFGRYNPWWSASSLVVQIETSDPEGMQPELSSNDKVVFSDHSQHDENVFRVPLDAFTPACQRALLRNPHVSRILRAEQGEIVAAAPEKTELQTYWLRLKVLVGKKTRKESILYMNGLRAWT